MEKRKIIVGSRESALAVAQTKIVMKAIEDANPDIETELVTMKTTGDIILDRTLDKVGGKGLFVKELDRALAEKIVDITVHSLKDLPAEVNEELPLIGFFKRGNPYDCLVMKKNSESSDFKKIGSASARRKVQLKDSNEKLVIEPVRGNVITRLEKLDSGQFDALVLAYSGLERLGLEYRVTKIFREDEMIPASGQGILVIQGRKGEDYSFIKAVDHEKTRLEAETERLFTRTLEGGCSSPIGAFSKVNMEEGTVEIYGCLAREDETGFCRDHISGKLADREKLAVELAERLRNRI